MTNITPTERAARFGVARFTIEDDGYDSVQIKMDGQPLLWIDIADGRVRGESFPIGSATANKLHKAGFSLIETQDGEVEIEFEQVKGKNWP